MATVKSERINFGKVTNQADTPDLLDIQLQSFQRIFTIRDYSGQKE